MEIVKASEYGLEQKQVNEVVLAFQAKVDERKLLTDIYGQLIKKDITKEVAKEARELRLKAVKIKSGIAAVHKTQKEYALAFGKYCDAWKRKETKPVQDIIDGAEAIEKHEQIQEQKRLEQLQKDRVSLVSKYIDEAETRNLSGMDTDVWEAFLSSKKSQYNERIAAEKERIAKEKEEKRKKELADNRIFKVSRLVNFIPDYDNLDFGLLSESDFDKIVKSAISKRKAKEKKDAEIEAENKRLKKRGRRQRSYKSKTSKRAKALFCFYS